MDFSSTFCGGAARMFSRHMILKNKKKTNLYVFSPKTRPFFHLHDREKTRIPKGWLLLLLYCVIAFEYTSVYSNAARQTFFIYARLSADSRPWHNHTPVAVRVTRLQSFMSPTRVLRPSIEFFTSRQHVTPFIFLFFFNSDARQSFCASLKWTAFIIITFFFFIQPCNKFHSNNNNTPKR